MSLDKQKIIDELLNGALNEQKQRFAEGTTLSLEDTECYRILVKLGLEDEKHEKD